MTTFRLMTVDDAADAASILRDSFPLHMRPYLPLAQRGTAAYLRSFFIVPHDAVTRRAFVAVEGGSVAGFAEFARPAVDVAFLSYICVAQDARGRGLAARLIAHGLREIDAPRMQLDVFDDNRAALRLYQRLGLREQGTKRTWSRRQMPPAGPTTAHALQPHITAACQDAYGFSQLEVELAGTCVTVGLIGDSVIRCPNADLLEDDSALRALRALLPERTEAIAVDLRAPSSADVLVRSVRLTAARDAIVERAEKGTI